MDFIKNVILLLLTCCVLTNCTSDGGAKEDALATAICECAEPVVALTAKMETLKKSGKIEELTNLMEEAGTLQDEAIKCSKNKKTGDINAANLKKAIDQNCSLPERFRDVLVDNLK